MCVNQWVFEAKEGGLHALALLDVALPLLPLPIKKLLLYECCSGQVNSLETPWAQLAVSCHTLLAAGLLFWHPGKKRSEVTQADITLCSVQCLGASLSPRGHILIQKRVLMFQSDRVTTCERKENIWMKKEQLWPSSAELGCNRFCRHTLMQFVLNKT